jgi:hypothetical protein
VGITITSSVDLVELVLLRLGGARHAAELVVHPEVVLDGDGGQRLGLGLDRDPLLGLHRLVQPVGPAPPGHHAAGELVHDHHLAVLHHVLLVAVEERVRLQELVDDVDPLALVGVLALQRVLRVALLVERERFVLLHPVHRLGDVGNHEGLVVVRGEHVQPLVGEVDGVPLLVHRVEEVLLQLVDLLLHHVVALDLPHHLHQAGVVGEHLLQALVARRALARQEQLLARGVGVALRDVLLGPGDQLVDDARLPPVQVHHAGLVRAYAAFASVPTGPEMMSGVRASSIRTESTSSTMA